MDNEPDYGSGDSRFDSWQARHYGLFILFAAKSIITAIYKNNKNISSEPDLNQWPMDNSTHLSIHFYSPTELSKDEISKK